VSTGSRDLADIVRALESLPVGVVVVDADDAIALVNRPAERLFGYDRSELIGQSVQILLPDGWWARQGPAGVALATVHRGSAPHEVLARRKDLSEVPIQLSLSPMTVGGAAFVAATAVDVTDRRRLESELRVLRDERLQFEALLGELAAEFVSLRPQDVDHALEDGLARVVRILDLDRGELFQAVDGGEFVRTHAWTRPGWGAPTPRRLSVHQSPWHVLRLRAGEWVAAASLDDVPDAIDRASLLHVGIKSAITIPLETAGETSGAVAFAALRQPRAWTLDVVTRLRLVAHIFARTVARKHTDEALRQAIAADAIVRARLQEENAYLRRDLAGPGADAALAGHSAPLRQLLAQVREAAGSHASVLLIGEPGSGRTAIAARIHELSPRGHRTMIRLQASTLTKAHLEQELAGDGVPIASTPSPRRSRLALAEGATLYLYEVAELPLDAQPILRTLLWDDAATPRDRPDGRLDARVIAATSRNLMRCVSEGSFREDLCFRLSALPIRIPPLRDRLEDVPLLVWRFVDEFSEASGKPIDTIDPQSMTELQEYHWPGNVRELRNVVERAMITATGRHLRIRLPADLRGQATLAEIEKEHILAVLAACDWRIEGEDGAAARLGLGPQALRARLKRLRIQRPR
jgi:PAS domain S-box-containing protein